MAEQTSEKKSYVIIPCYNEQESITQVIEELHSKCPSVQIVVVNDGSSDETASEVIKTGKALLIDLPVNLGVGGAMQTGFMYSVEKNAQATIKLDGDGQHPPESINQLLEPVINGTADIVIGSRFLEKNEGFQSSFMRRIGVKIIQLACRILTGQSITDPTSGFRAYSQKAQSLFATNYPDFDYPEPEEIVFATRSSLKITEIPVIMRKRTAGHSSISSSVSVYYMVKVTLAMLFISFRSRNSFIRKAGE